MHAGLYPEMKPADVVKLVFQNEFGGGHLIEDPQASLAYLISEAEGTPSNESLPLFVPIGNGLVRVNIAAVTNYRLDFEQLNDIFVESAARVKGSAESFYEKLREASSAVQEGVFGFSEDEFGRYLEAYIAAGCPMVSHSETYREIYAPAYRVVLKEILPEEITADTGCCEQ